MRTTTTEEIINEILDLPVDSDIAGKYLREFPIHLDVPSDFQIDHFLGVNGIDTIGRAGEIHNLTVAIRLAKAFHNDKLTLKERRQLSNPQQIVNLVKDELETATQEMLYVIALTTKNDVIGKWEVAASDLKASERLLKKDVVAKEMVFKGSLNATTIHPREIFKVAIAHSAASIVLVHNHPSGDPAPSPEDIKATQELKKAGELMQIPLIDHIIIGDGTYFSMREDNVI